jgi:hypothetical protein
MLDGLIDSCVVITQRYYLKQINAEILPETHNKATLLEANEQRHIFADIMKRQAKFIAHVLKKRTLEDIMTTGKISEKRGRGRQRENILDGLTKWMGFKTSR